MIYDNSDEKFRTVAVFTRGLNKITVLKEILGVDNILLNPGAAKAESVDLVVGWGQKRRARFAKRYAERHNIGYLYLEDGFLRSVGLGVEGDTPASLVMDDQGIYYDATGASRLESILNLPEGEADPLGDPELLERAERCMKRIVAARLSKYNNSPPGDVVLEDDGDAKRVLVIDQTVGDISIQRGLVPPNGFKAMLAAALEENPHARIIVKTHPDVLAGKKRGYLTGQTADSRVSVLGTDVNPIALIEQVDRVYTATSQLGFEALMVGKPVTCFGAPFYAGWGLTDDRLSLARRVRRRSLRELFAAAYILYPRYIDPDSGHRCEIETVIDFLARQRRYFQLNAGTIFCYGFSVWKQNYVRDYLRCPKNKVVFFKTAAEAERLGFNSESKLLVWGTREPEEIARLAEKFFVTLWRMEDGFLRSIGLGSDLTAPASLVVDTRGIYYNPHGPSDLEAMLQEGEFTEDELERARRLRSEIVAAKVSKYNVGGQETIALPEDPNRTVILVPGQVEDDASIRLGCVDVNTNAGLLSQVRRQNPDAFIIFKPHPDVASGNRQGHVPIERASELCDAVVEDISIARCLDLAHEVHTMTSLVGFESLLRGLRVHVYGRPFYSGWGLTNDRHTVDRRTRQLTLDELVTGTLIRYPRYLNADNRRFTTPEFIVSTLRSKRDAQSGKLGFKMPWYARQIRKLYQVLRGIIHVR